MSILIKGMDMPKKTYAHCMLIKDLDGSVQLHVCTKNSEEMSEWELYDLVPVPPGRLIDADALMDQDGDVWDGVWGYSGVQIANAPTVIEAEEGET